MALARAIRVVVGIVVAIIVVAVILRLLGANPGNAIVSDIHDAGAWLVGPFKDVFSVKGPKLHMALNWGLAALIYAVVGGSSPASWRGEPQPDPAGAGSVVRVPSPDPREHRWISPLRGQRTAAGGVPSPPRPAAAARRARRRPGAGRRS